MTFPYLWEPTENMAGPAGWVPAAMRWADRANCAGCDPDLFFPDRGASLAEAKAVCAGCVVRDECLEYALAAGERFGVWGGLSERERRRIRVERQREGRR